MNEELRTKIKKADTILSKLGYSFNIDVRNKNKVYLVNNNSETIRLVLSEALNPNTKLIGWNFLSGIQTYTNNVGVIMVAMKHEQADETCKLWQKIIKAQKQLNELEIAGTREEINECVRDVRDKKRKSIYN